MNKMKTLVAFAALIMCGGAWAVAPSPVAVWNGDLGASAKSGYGMWLAFGVSTGDNGVVTTTKSNSSTSPAYEGLKISCGDNAFSTPKTIAVKYSGLEKTGANDVFLALERTDGSELLIYYKGSDLGLASPNTTGNLLGHTSCNPPTEGTMMISTSEAGTKITCLPTSGSASMYELTNNDAAKISSISNIRIGGGKVRIGWYYRPKMTIEAVAIFDKIVDSADIGSIVWTPTAASTVSLINYTNTDKGFSGADNAKSQITKLILYPLDGLSANSIVRVKSIAMGKRTSGAADTPDHLELVGVNSSTAYDVPFGGKTMSRFTFDTSVYVKVGTDGAALYSKNAAGGNAESGFGLYKADSAIDNQYKSVWCDWLSGKVYTIPYVIELEEYTYLKYANSTASLVSGDGTTASPKAGDTIVIDDSHYTDIWKVGNHSEFTTFPILDQCKLVLYSRMNFYHSIAANQEVVVNADAYVYGDVGAGAMISGQGNFDVGWSGNNANIGNDVTIGSKTFTIQSGKTASVNGAVTITSSTVTIADAGALILNAADASITAPSTLTGDKISVGVSNMLLATTDNQDDTITYALIPAVAHVGDIGYATMNDACAAAAENGKSVVPVDSAAAIPDEYAETFVKTTVGDTVIIRKKNSLIDWKSTNTADWNAFNNDNHRYTTQDGFDTTYETGDTICFVGSNIQVYTQKAALGAKIQIGKDADHTASVGFTRSGDNNSGNDYVLSNSDIVIKSGSSLHLRRWGFGDSTWDSYQNANPDFSKVYNCPITGEGSIVLGNGVAAFFDGTTTVEVPVTLEANATYTQTIELGASAVLDVKAAANIPACAVKGSGKIKIPSMFDNGAQFGACSTCAFTAADWTGTVEVAAIEENSTSGEHTQFKMHLLGNANSTIIWHGDSGTRGKWIPDGESNKIAAKVVLEGDLLFNNGSSGGNYYFGEIDGKNTENNISFLTWRQNDGVGASYHVDKLSNFAGKITATRYTTISELALNAMPTTANQKILTFGTPNGSYHTSSVSFAIGSVTVDGENVALALNIVQDDGVYVLPVAQVGDTQYVTVNAAFENAGADGVVKLIADINTAVTIPAGKKLDVNGHTVNGKITCGEGAYLIENGKPKIDGIATDIDLTFNGNKNMDYTNFGGSVGCNGTASYNNSKNDTTTGIYLKHRPWIDGAGTFFTTTKQITFATAGVMPNQNNSLFVHMGDAKNNGYGLFLATGTNVNEVVVGYNYNAAPTTITTINVPNARTHRHTYIITKDDDLSDSENTSTTFTIYLDGVKWKTFVREPRFEITGGFQVGSSYHQILTGYSMAPDNNNAYVNFMRAYQRIITPEEIARYSEVYDYDSPNGTYERTMTADGNWVENGTWTSGENTVEKPSLNGNVVLTANAEGSTTAVSINLTEDVEYEKLTLTGTAMSFARVDASAKSVKAVCTVIGAPVTLNHRAVVLTAGPTIIVEGGSLTFDFSSLTATEVAKNPAGVLTMAVTGEMDQQATGVVSLTRPTDPDIKSAEIGYNQNHYEVVVRNYAAKIVNGETVMHYDTLADALTAARLDPTQVTILDGTKTLPEGSPYYAYCVGEGGVIQVAKACIGTAHGYATLEAALAAAQANDTVTLLAANAENVTIPANVTVDVNGQTFTGSVSGSGKIKYAGFDSVQASVKTSLQNTNWEGTLLISDKSNIENGSSGSSGATQYKTLLNDFGNSGSEIEFAGNCSGYFGLSKKSADDTLITVQPEIVISGTLDLNNGFSQRNDGSKYYCTQFRKLSGAGTIKCTSSNNDFQPRYFFNDVSGFTGKFESTKQKIIIGQYEETVLPMGTMQIQSGYSATMPQGVDWTASASIKVDGTLNIDLGNGATRAYETKLTGTGTIASVAKESQSKLVLNNVAEFTGSITAGKLAHIMLVGSGTTTALGFSTSSYVCVESGSPTLASGAIWKGSGYGADASGVIIWSNGTLKMNGGTIDGKLYCKQGATWNIGSYESTSCTVTGQIQLAGNSDKITVVLPSGTPTADSFKVVGWGSKVAAVTESTFTSTSVPDGFLLVVKSDGLYLEAQADITTSEEKVANNVATAGYISLGQDGVYTVTGNGGLTIDTLKLKNGSKIVFDPVRNPILANKLAIESGATIKLVSGREGHTSEYESITCGLFRLFSYPNTIELNTSGIVIEGLAANVTKTLKVITVEGTDYKQLVLDVGDYEHNGKVLKITQFGDSITEGIWRSGYVGTPNYRIPLMHRLETHGYKPMTTGFRGDTLKNGTAWGSSDANGVRADPNYRLHNGVSAQRVYTGHASRAGFLEGIEAYLEASGDEQDVITLKIGTNDINGGETAANVYKGWEKLVKRLIKLRPQTRIVVTSILELANGNNTAGGTYSAMIKTAVEGDAETGAKPIFPANTVFYVDCRSASPQNATPQNFLANYGSGSDYVHPNWTGYNKMADQWVEGVMRAANASTKKTYEPHLTTGAAANVPAAYRKGFVKLATMDFSQIQKKGTDWGASPYTASNSAMADKKLTKVAYYVERSTDSSANTQFVWADMDSWAESDSAKNLNGMGVPTSTQNNVIVENLHIYSNLDEIEQVEPTKSGVKGTLLFTNKGLGAGGTDRTASGIPNNKYGFDWNDSLANNANWGAMVLSRVFTNAERSWDDDHRWAVGQTLFSYNTFNNSSRKNVFGIGDFAVHCLQESGNSGLDNAGYNLTLNWVNTGPEFTYMTADKLDYGVIEIWGVPEGYVVPDSDEGFEVTADDADAAIAAAQILPDTEADTAAGGEATRKGYLTITATAVEGETGKFNVQAIVDNAKLPTKIEDTAVSFAQTGLEAVAGATATTNVAIPAAKVVPGLYYSVSFGTTPDNHTKESDRVLATGTDVTIPVPALGNEKVYYIKVKASATK